MNDFTAEQEAKIAEAIKNRKPYLLKIEEEVQRINYGSFKVVVEIRGGMVDKMKFEEVSKSWLRDKSLDTK